MYELTDREVVATIARVHSIGYKKTRKLPSIGAYLDSFQLRYAFKTELRRGTPASRIPLAEAAMRGLDSPTSTDGSPFILNTYPFRTSTSEFGYPFWRRHYLLARILVREPLYISAPAQQGKKSVSLPDFLREIYSYAKDDYKANILTPLRDVGVF